MSSASAARSRLPSQARRAICSASRSASSTMSASVRPASARLLRHLRQDVVGRDDAARAQRHRLLDHVLELADVAREVVLDELLDHALGEAGVRVHLPVVLVEEELDEQRDVFAPLAQRRQMEARDVEAVVEVLAEALLCDRLRQIRVGGRDDADVDLDRLVLADAADLALLDARAAAWPGTTAWSRRSRRRRTCRRRPPRTGPCARRRRR